MKRPILFALEVAAGLILAAAGAWIANRLSHKANREAQALERIAAVAERAYPVRTLPQPSLYRADLKPIPAPDPEPCGDYVCGGDQISQATKVPNLLKPAHIVHADGTTTDFDGCNTTTCGPRNADGSQACATTALYCGATPPTLGGTAVER